MSDYLLSPLTWTLTALCGAIVYIVISIYRDAARDRRKRQTQEDAAIIARLKAAGDRKWEGHQK